MLHSYGFLHELLSIREFVLQVRTLKAKFYCICVNVSCRDVNKITLTFYRRHILFFIYGISPYRALNTFHRTFKSALYKQSERTALQTFFIMIVKSYKFWCIKRRSLSFHLSIQNTQRNITTRLNFLLWNLVAPKETAWFYNVKIN
jgi:hypothetical protein